MEKTLAILARMENKAEILKTWLGAYEDAKAKQDLDEMARTKAMFLNHRNQLRAMAEIAALAGAIEMMEQVFVELDICMVQDIPQGAEHSIREMWENHLERKQKQAKPQPKAKAKAESTVYTENGFANRKAYLAHLAEEYGKARVMSLASMLGPSEDFDGLVTSLEDAQYMEGWN